MVTVYRIPQAAGGSATLSTSNTFYIPVGQTYAIFSQTTYANAATTVQTAGYIKNLRCYVSANAATARTMTLYKNGSPTALTLTIGASATGAFEDSTNMVTVSAGDTLAIGIVMNAATSITIKSVTCDFLATDATVLLSSLSASTQAVNADRYTRPNGITGLSTADDGVTNMVVPTAATFKNIQVYAATNTGTNNTDFYLRKNMTNSALVTTVTTATGLFADTVNTVSVAQGDTVNYFFDELGTSNFAMTRFGSEANSSTGKGFVFSAQVGGTIGSGATRYRGVSGYSMVETTEAPAEIVLRGTGTIRKMYTNITGNSLVGTCDFTMRKNNADTALTFQVLAAGTGSYSDTTNSFTYADGDRICIKSVTSAGTGTLTVPWFSFEIEPDAEIINPPMGGLINSVVWWN